LADLAKDEEKCPGFFLGGNYRTGVAFGDCVQFGWTEAEKVASFLKTSSSLQSSKDIPESVKAPIDETADVEATVVVS
jgi:hypothetical protein